MGIREGLSFSDYLDDSIPADVKPPEMLCPMEEGQGENEFIPSPISRPPYGWMDKDGNFYNVSFHKSWADKYLQQKKIPIDTYTKHEYYTLYNLGFIRISYTTTSIGMMLAFTYNNQGPKPTNIQLRNLRNYCIENEYELFDDAKDKKIELNENINENINDEFIDGDGWLDKDGKFYKIDKYYHERFAREYLNKLKINDPLVSCYLQMYQLGFLRIVFQPREENLFFNNSIHKPTNIQLRKMKDFCIDRNWTLQDGQSGNNISLDEEIQNTQGQDYPTQAKDLFKGLWEGKTTIKTDGWMDKDGNYHNVTYHGDWGRTYLDSIGIESTKDNVYRKMYKLGFLRVRFDDGKTLHFEYHIRQPTTIQLRNLKNWAIENQYKLYDDIKKSEVDLLEESYSSNSTEFKSDKTLFIENMMPNDTETFKSHLVQLFAYLKKELKLKTIPTVKLVSDEKNANKVLGKTAYYNPETKEITLFITNRHQKDILRSFAHEVIHHWQHEHNKLENMSNDPKYAQNNPWMRQMEKQAYLLGNILFRDWEDKKKSKDRKSGKKLSELYGKGNIAIDSNTKLMKKTYDKKHPYRKYVEGPPEPDVKDLKEKTSLIGKEYPIKRR